MDEEEWFVTNGEWRMGPLALDDLIEVLGREHAPGSLLVWKTGLETWIRPELVPQLTTAAAARTPVRVGRPAEGVAAGAGAGFGAGGGTGFAAGIGAAGPLAAPWFRVGTAKLLLMCVGTLGFYQVYWFYQQWRHVQRRGERVQPAPRALFNPIFCYSLFRRVSADALERGVPRVPSALACAVGWSLPWVAAFLIALGSSPSPFVPLPLSLSLPLSLLQLLSLALVQRAASAAALAAVPGADPNTRLTPINWVGIAFGAMILLWLATLQSPVPATPAPTPTTQAVLTADAGRPTSQAAPRLR